MRWIPTMVKHFWSHSLVPDVMKYVPSASLGYWYFCPDVAVLDGHIADLREGLGSGSNLTEWAKCIARSDIDVLLERRLFLSMMERGVAA